MGSQCQVCVFANTGTPLRELQALACLGVERVALLEKSWSRFIPTSELSHLNETGRGRWVEVSEDLFALVASMKTAWIATDGAFDPSIYEALMSLGYTLDVAALPWRGAYSPSGSSAPGLAEVRLDEDAQSVWLPQHVRLDPGGIGKGLAADIVSRELLSTGVSGVLVDIGGDLSLRGSIPGKDRWHIDIEPRNHASIRVELPVTSPDSHRGVATSGLKTRQWGEHLFHIVDPSSGLPAVSNVAEVTIFASSAWIAEAYTKATILAHDPLDFLRSRDDLEGILFLQDGTTLWTKTPQHMAVM